MTGCVSCGLFIFLGTAIALAQQPVAKPAFEVISIKPFDSDPSRQMWTGMNADPGIVHYTNITLKACIRAAYRVRDFQIKGPAWIDDARFEITAKLPSGVHQDQIPEMLQALLSERFKLTISREMKEQSVYALVVAQGGPSLKPAEVNPDSKAPMSVGPDGRPRPLISYQLVPSGMLVKAPSVRLAALAEFVSRFTEQPVIDMTGLAGQYEIEFIFAPETTTNLPPAGTTAPDGSAVFSEPGISLSDAIRKYGLKIEKRKAPIEILTVTHLQRMPTEN